MIPRMLSRPRQINKSTQHRKMEVKMSKVILNLIVFVLLLIPLSLNAETIGISKDEFMPYYRAQQTPMWCWASSAEMVLAYKEINLPQETIVTKIKGAPLPVGGNPYDMIASTNSLLKDKDGKSVVVSGQFVIGTPIWTVLFNQMKNKRPVILTYSTGQWAGHAVVLIGIDYYKINDNIKISKFNIIDPFSFVQKLDMANRPYFAEDNNLRYRKYTIENSPSGLFMKDGAMVIGTVTGMILIDASYL